MLSVHDWDLLFKQHETYERWLDQNLALLDAPAILLGDEMNTVHFDWLAARAEGTLDDRFKVAFVDVSATGYAACSAAVKIFYQQLHECRPDWVVERSFLPASAGNRALMAEADIPLMSAGGHMPLSCFDVICCSQQMIGDEVNLIDMLLSMNMGATWQERSDDDPIIIRGGASSFNPSVMKDVCDLYFIGEGEDVLPDLLDLVEDGLRQGLDHENIVLAAVQRWDCLWAPRFYEERFADDGELLGMFPLRDDVPSVIRSHYVPDLDECFIMTKPIGDFQYPSFISGGVEVTRGCDGGCSFCVSGFTYLPFRARSVEKVMGAIEQHVRYSGERSPALNSFCGSAYPYLNELTRSICQFGLPSVRMLSQRIDSVHENPDMFGLLVRMGVKRIVFGVEGISQRLRQTVSKNYTESQILDTIKMLARCGYETVKLMFICGLPGECQRDWDELVALSAKIRALLDAVESEGHKRPKVMYTWTPLSVCPFTPFQWLAPRVRTFITPEGVAERLREQGVIVNEKDLEGGHADNVVTQLLMRGDSRLQPMLVDMAQSGLCRHGAFTDAAEAFMDAWIAGHEVPGIGYWLREAGQDTVFPWDFISYGAQKAHLWKRYVESCKEEPCDFPRCLDRCQGCGACTDTHRVRMAEYRKAKRQDNALRLSDLMVDALASAGSGFPHYAVIEFDVDARHRFVNCVYWEDELRRALNLAGIRYNRDGTRVLKPYHVRYDWAQGLNAAIMSFADRIEAGEFVAAVNAHAVNLHVTDVRWFDQRPSLVSMSYRIPVPDAVDTAQLQARASRVMDSDSWVVKRSVHSDGGDYESLRDIRDEVYELAVDGRDLVMRVDPRTPPYQVYQALLGLEWDEASRFVATRTQIDYDSGTTHAQEREDRA